MLDIGEYSAPVQYFNLQVEPPAYDIMPFQKRLNINELSWLTVDLGPLEADDSSDGPRGLKEVCLEKLVTDVCLFRNLTGLPKSIYSMLLSTALDQHRTLSISQLMKYSPHKEIKLPIPEALRNWESVVTPGHLVKYHVERYTDNAITMLSTYFCLIEESCETTQLNVLDLGYFPWGPDTLKVLFSYISPRGDPKKGSIPELYTLKSAFTFDYDEAAKEFLDTSNAAEKHGLYIVLKGLECHNCILPERVMLDIFEKVKPSDFVHFTLNFAKIVPSLDMFVINLAKFYNLKYLNFSYQTFNFSSDPLLRSLAVTLAELPHLSRLILQGNNLHGCTEILFQKYCKKDSSATKKSKTENGSCCLIHNGSLEFLDISACKLFDEDILFLREIALGKTLKYLNIGLNTLTGMSAFQTLLTLKSSLVVLEMDKAFSRYPAFNIQWFPFSEFTQLRYLNMKGIQLTSANIQQFIDEQAKVPNLVLHRDEANLPAPTRFEWTGIPLPPELFFLVPD